MMSKEKFKNISTNVKEETYYQINEKCKTLGLNKSQYFRSLINKDLGIEDIIETPKQQSMLDKLKKAFGVNVETDNIIKPTRNIIRVSTAIWKPSESIKERNSTLNDRKYYFDYETGLIKYNTINTKRTYTACSLNELLIIHECKPVYRKDVTELRKLLKKDNTDSSFTGLIYQYQQGVFDEIIHNFKTNVTKCKFKIQSNKLWLMGKESTITISTAKELISLIENNEFTELYIYKLCKSYSICNEVDVRIVCENYNNPELLSLLNQPVKNPVLNHPSKRRNVIRNNGTLGGGGVIK